MKKIFNIILLIFLSILFLLICLEFNRSFDFWIFLTFFMMFFSIIIMYYQSERGIISSKEISLIAILSGFSSVSRIPFAAIPSIQPCTFIIICTGYVFGPVAGFMVGSTTALISNIFLGQGPWTIFQMFAWGIAGASAAFVQKLNIKKYGLVVFGIIWGYFFGWIMNIWTWFAFIYPHTITTLGYVMVSSIYFDSLHAIGNALFFIFLGEKTIKILQRYKRRFHIEYGDRKQVNPSIEPVHQVSDIVQ